MRPISLANNIAKLFEKLIQFRLEWWIENNFVLPNFQFGFRRGLSCNDNLVFFTSHILKTFVERQQLGVIFIDIKHTFDNVKQDKLLAILHKCGLSSKIIRFIQHMLEHRLVEGYYNGASLGSRVASKGVPQGSVLSSVLFNLKIHISKCFQ